MMELQLEGSYVLGGYFGVGKFTEIGRSIAGMTVKGKRPWACSKMAGADKYTPEFVKLLGVPFGS